LALGEGTFHFLDAHLGDARLTGFLGNPDGRGRRSNPHMHLLNPSLRGTPRATMYSPCGIIDLFRSHFSMPRALGEF
jgi:hypothetical protein